MFSYNGENLMLYCPRCGVPLPQNEEVNFCPNCGLSIVTPSYGKRGTFEAQPAKWHGIVPRRSSLRIFVVVFILCIIVTSIGAATIINLDAARQITDELNQEQNAIQVAGVQIIFGNNLMQALIMFTWTRTDLGLLRPLQYRSSYFCHRRGCKSPTKSTFALCIIVRHAIRMAGICILQPSDI